MKARKRINPGPIPKGVVVRTGGDEPPEDLSVDSAKRIDPTLIDWSKDAEDQESRRCPHVVTVKRKSGDKPKYRNIGGLCFDEYGSGLPGVTVVNVTNLHLALMAQSKKDQLGHGDC